MCDSPPPQVVFFMTVAMMRFSAFCWGVRPGKPTEGTSLQNSIWHKHSLFFQEYASPIRDSGPLDPCIKRISPSNDTAGNCYYFEFGSPTVCMRLLTKNPSQQGGPLLKIWVVFKPSRILRCNNLKPKLNMCIKCILLIGKAHKKHHTFSADAFTARSQGCLNASSAVKRLEQSKTNSRS